MVKEKPLPTDVISLAQTLIRIPSPSGGEAGMARFVSRFFREADFDCVIDAANTVVAWHTFGPGPIVLFDGHIDTVSVDAARWRTSPYGGTVEVGRFHGRGASDMNGAFAAMMVAAPTLVREVCCGQRGLAGTLVVTGTSWEKVTQDMRSVAPLWSWRIGVCVLPLSSLARPRI